VINSYAFATYEKKEAALAAIKNMHGVLLGTRQIKGKIIV
jgi:hypothetical protein